MVMGRMDDNPIENQRETEAELVTNEVQRMQVDAMTEERCWQHQILQHIVLITPHNGMNAQKRKR